MEIKDYEHINSEELNWLKRELKNILKPILPYTAKNGVGFNYNNIMGLGTREGIIEVDNGCGARREDGRNYYLILKYRPYFTNRSGFDGSLRVKGNEITTETMEELSKVVEQSIVKFAFSLTRGFDLHSHLREERLRKLLN